MTSKVSRVATSIWRRLPNTLNQAATAAYFKGSAILNVGYRGKHSTSKHLTHFGMEVKILPALSDNYMYLIIDQDTKEAAIVDPVDPNAVADAIIEENVNLTTVLTTHHHWDHAGGNKQLKDMMPNLRFFGGDSRIDCLTTKVSHDTKLSIGQLSVTCLYTPCHTSGHICYYVTSNNSSDNNDKAVFTGDTLFIGGCGRFFEGSADQMNTSLNTILGALPGETNVYCGHEYTTANLKFGLHVEPDNQDIINALADAQKQRSKSPPEPTVPSTIEREKLINPFMRVSLPTVRIHAGGTDCDIQTMQFIRAEKDNFKAA